MHEMKGIAMQNQATGAGGGQQRPPPDQAKAPAPITKPQEK